MTKIVINMKISLLLVYYNRKQQLINTLSSIYKSKHIDQCEIIIVDDASDTEHRIEDLLSEKIKFYRVKPEEKNWMTPVIPHNKTISMATGDLVIQQCAECYHTEDIIDHAINNITNENYLVYSCYALKPDESISDFKIKNNQWYQHSLHKPNCYNFCTAISKNNLLKLGGFDERYSTLNGIGYADNDFIDRVRLLGLTVKQYDKPFVIHQHHEKIYKNKVTQINKNIYKSTVLKNYYTKNSFINE